MLPALDTSRPTDFQGNEDKPEGSFAQRLPAQTWDTLLKRGLRGRIFARDERLPLEREDGDVYIIWEGLVRQDRFPLGTGEGIPTITRFRGGGQLVGEAKLINCGAAVATRCLTRTAVIHCDARYFNVLLDRLPQVQRALLRSLEDRNRSDELVYTLATRPPLERISRLLAHLADTAGVPAPRTSNYTVISGPSQKDIAAALQIALSTTETAIRTLRYHGVIEARYRQFIVHDVDALRHFAAGN
ncbi:Crp/Fnr family transcriptional regulator [Streptomyces sp. NPDC085900]|uniref:Crp/Fnr family transcriptional regulator n=1 Tax=Streptomyces sp. NPDC085900 TaxID=3365737 RepID=UPI0037D9127F